MKVVTHIGIDVILSLIFMTLKLLGVIDWSWWWVWAPIWIPFLVLSIMGIIALIIILLYLFLGSPQRKFYKFK